MNPRIKEYSAMISISILTLVIGIVCAALILQFHLERSLPAIVLIIVAGGLVVSVVAPVILRRLVGTYSKPS